MYIKVLLLLKKKLPLILELAPKGRTMFHIQH